MWMILLCKFLPRHLVGFWNGWPPILHGPAYWQLYYLLFLLWCVLESSPLAIILRLVEVSNSPWSASLGIIVLLCSGPEFVYLLIWCWKYVRAFKPFAPYYWTRMYPWLTFIKTTKDGANLYETESEKKRGLTQPPPFNNINANLTATNKLWTTECDIGAPRLHRGGQLGIITPKNLGGARPLQI